MVTVRLFNVLQKEVGPELLRKGIRIPGPVWADFLNRHTKSLLPAIKTATLDGRSIEVPTLWERAWKDRDVELLATASS